MAQGEASIRVYLPPEIKDRFKTICFFKGLNMSDVSAELIEDWLAKNEMELPNSAKISPSPTGQNGNRSA
ncbi:plasmid partition protein ParG [Anabaenopsis sp. FSS-46]|uniref:plasmid partition protein ParG n=1 Tax=Nostocales TaxID=1161 RepID=UPI0023307BF5|nr:MULTISPECIES: plasmid partition protein ParG [Nostocales]MDB9446594.1 plasmid partition protein ParG [Anabaena sp. CS-542/02]MDH6100078.1 plasmid partition protein ParG [Anabaenopsis sp. FSS-46]